MLDAIVISSKQESELGKNLAEVLSQAGFNSAALAICTGERENSQLEETNIASTVIVYPDSHDALLYLHVGMLIGQKKRILLLTDHPEHLPRLLRQCPCIAASSPSTGSAVVEHLNSILSREVIPLDTDTSDPVRFLHWISADIGRLQKLNSQQFEKLVSLLVLEIGCTRRHDVASVFEDPRSNSTIYVQCKSFPSGHKVGLDDVRQAAADALPLGCDFALFVTPNDFTRSAIKFARSSVPPIWLLSRTHVEQMIEVAIERKSPDALRTTLLPLFLGNAREAWWKTAKRDQGQSDRLLNVESEWLSYQVNNDWTEEIGWQRPWVRRQKAVKCEAFIATPHQISDSFHMLVQSLRDAGITVWHDSSNVNVGTYCKRLDDIVSAVRRSAVVVLVNDGPSDVSTSKKSVLQAVAGEMEKEGASHIVFVLGTANLWNRLRLPEAFLHSTFLDPGVGGWSRVIVDACEPKEIPSDGGASSGEKIG